MTYFHTKSQPEVRASTLEMMVKREFFFSSSFTIFNRTYSSVVISGNGVVTGFGDTDEDHIPHSAVCRGTQSDFQKIMAFWSDGYHKHSATLTFMETSRAPLLQKARQDIAKGFPALNERELDVSWLFIVTWRNIPKCCSDSDPTKQNTFQLVLAKSSTRSFVLLYYTKIQWYNERWAAGFDFGNSRPPYRISGSCTSNYEIITRTSNIGENGKWVFGVESDLILPSTGIEDDNNGQDEKIVMQIEPRVVSRMGKAAISIEGLKIGEEISNVTFTCVFHDPSRTRPSETSGVVLSWPEDDPFVLCPVPFLYSLGRMEISVRVKHPSHPAIWMPQGHIYVVKEPKVRPLPVISLNTTQDNLLSASWNQRSFGRTLLLEVTQIVLLEYKRGSWKELGPVTQPFRNNGTYSGSLNMTNFHELIKSSAGKPYLRTFALKSPYLFGLGGEIDKLVPSSPLLSTDMIISLQQITNLGPVDNSTGNLYDKLCKAWYEKEPHPPTHLDTIPCPRTVEQARIDWRFAPDNASVSELEIYYPGATTSFTQKVPSASGSASQCTYDTEGRLLISIPGAGRLQRSSPNNRKDTWGHYEKDILPYLYCCRWGTFKESNCISFYKKRPSNDGSKYVPPQASRATGLSNIVTFNGYNFTLAGHGEFWAIKYSSSQDFDDDMSGHVYHTNEFKMQVRLEPYNSSPSNETVKHASIITAAVIEDTTNEREVNVQVSLNTPHISVIVDGQEEDMMGSHDKTAFNLYYDGVTISFQSRNQVLASFASGFSVLFMTSGTNDSSLNIVATHSLHDAKIRKGLVGDFRQNLESQNSSSWDAANYPEISEWMVVQNETLFYYPKEKSYADYNPKQNIFGINGIELEPYRDVPQVGFCNDFHDCNYDYFVTKSRSISEGGKDACAIYEKVVFVSSVHVHQCKLPDNIEHGHFKVSSLVVGSNISISCNPGYKLLPDEITFTCQYSILGENVSWMNGNLSMSSLTCVTENNEVTAFYPEDSSTITVDETDATTEVEYVTGLQSPNVQDESAGSESSSYLFIVFICIVISLVFVIVFGVVIAKCDRFRPARAFIVNGYRLRRKGDFELIRYEK